MSVGEARSGQEVWGVGIAVTARGSRIWPDEIKAMAARRVAEGARAQDIAAELGVTLSLLYKWIKAARDQSGATEFVELLPPATGKAAEVMASKSATACVLRLGDVAVDVPPGFPASELTGILLAIKAAQ